MALILDLAGHGPLEPTNRDMNGAVSGGLDLMLNVGRKTDIVITNAQDIRLFKEQSNKLLLLIRREGHAIELELTPKGVSVPTALIRRGVWGFARDVDSTVRS